MNQQHNRYVVMIYEEYAKAGAMMKFFLSLIIAILLNIATVAQALPGDRYAGFTVGKAWNTLDLDGKKDAASGEVDGDQWSVAAVAGIAWNSTFGSYVGVEGELEYASSNMDTYEAGKIDGDNNTYSAGVFGRAGWWFWSSVLFYGKAGVKYNLVDFDNGGSIGADSLEVGIGTEYILNEQWTLRAEYSREWMNDSSDVFKDYDIDIKKHNVTLGVTHHF